MNYYYTLEFRDVFYYLPYTFTIVFDTYINSIVILFLHLRIFKSLNFHLFCATYIRNKDIVLEIFLITLGYNLTLLLFYNEVKFTRILRKYLFNRHQFAIQKIHSV